MNYYKIVGICWVQIPFDVTKKQITIYEEDCKTVFGIGLY